jgi:3-oxoadipate enol-lactonase
VFEAGYATCQFDSRGWIGEVDVPTSVVVTSRDRAIPADAQRRLAQSIGDATVYTVDGDHTACLHADFAPVLVAACRDVAARSGARP